MTARVTIKKPEIGQTAQPLRLDIECGLTEDVMNSEAFRHGPFRMPDRSGQQRHDAAPTIQPVEIDQCL